MRRCMCCRRTGFAIRGLGTEAVPETQQTIQQGIYKGFIGPIALYGLLGLAVFRARRSQKEEGPDGGGDA